MKSLLSLFSCGLAVPAAGGRVVVSDGRGLNYAEGEIPSGDGVTPRTTTVPIRMPLTTGRQAVRIAFFTANGGTFGSLESITFK